MSNKEKKDKLRLFRLPDLIIYAVVTIIVLSLFLIPLLSLKKGTLNGFDIYKEGKLIFSLSFENYEKYFLDKDSEQLVEISYKENAMLIKVFKDSEKKDFNLIFSNLKEKSVSVTESTCSIKKDCTHFKPIVNNSGVIICEPHGLKILPKGERFVPVVTGWIYEK